MHINKQGWLEEERHCPSPHYNQRPITNDISLLVIHNISLPPGKFGGPYIDDLFLGKLDPDADAYFKDIYQMQVSAHCLIQRSGKVTQYVSFNERAWHAGVSEYEGRENCNDFSIGIELEGIDDLAYTDEQYSQLVSLVSDLISAYPALTKERITGHCDIAPERKTDPGDSFDWERFNILLTKQLEKSLISKENNELN